MSDVIKGTSNQHYPYRAYKCNKLSCNLVEAIVRGAPIYIIYI